MASRINVALFYFKINWATKSFIKYLKDINPLSAFNDFAGRSYFIKIKPAFLFYKNNLKILQYMRLIY
ncbi:MAG: hypothetical protein HCTKY_4880 [Candidatus Hepatoplasma crinochetorum]|nr:MAG: hypothetical protein HCTKY_4880 [Candidatus Hepatoplasma crinochetorum]